MIVDIEAFGYRTLAGNEQNWPYAAYELDQLRETFADVAQIRPKYRDLSVPDLITSTVKDPLVALDRAIQTKDGRQFTAAYAQLTAACNVCHQRYDRTAIMIQQPTAAAPFPAPAVKTALKSREHVGLLFLKFGLADNSGVPQLAQLLDKADSVSLRRMLRGRRSGQLRLSHDEGARGSKDVEVLAPQSNAMGRSLRTLRRAGSSLMMPNI